MAILREALESKVGAGTRRAAVVADLVAANKAVESSVVDDMANALHATMKNYKRLDRRTEADLEDLGFRITSDGKHHKLVFRSDQRYTFTIPKTPSDHRSGKNASSQIRRDLF